MKETVLRVFMVLIFLAVAGAFLYFDTFKYLTLENLKNSQDFLAGWYAEHRVLAPIFFLVLLITWMAFSLPMPLLLTVAAGAIFGVWLTTGLAVLASALGGTLAFLSSRYVFGAWVSKKFGSGVKVLEANVEKNAVSYLLFMRLVPGIPFFMVNILAGVTRIKTSNFFITTLIGVFPFTLIEAHAGSQLGQIDALEDILSGQVLLSLGLLGLLALVPVIYRKWQNSRKRKG